MSAREKAQARAKLKERTEAEFFERTGIRNEAQDWTMENLMNRYDYDMAKLEKEDKKKRQ